MKKRRRPRTKNRYFTKIHEDAIVRYSSTTSREIRTDLYISLIEPAFNELVDKITFTYKFTALPNVDSLRDECKIWLMTILDKYDPSKGSKAFSYFSVITKHWFIHKFKKNSNRNKKEVSYEEIVRESKHEKLIYKGDSYYNKREKLEFWNSLKVEVDRWQDSNIFTKENEQKVLCAVKILLDNVDKIDILNKKAVYLYLREITGLKTKQVVNTLNKMRERYKYFVIKYERGDNFLQK